MSIKPIKEYISINIYTHNSHLTQWLKAKITGYWIVVESSSVHQQSDLSFYHYTIFLFHFYSVLIFNQLMSTKKQIPSLCKVHSVYEEFPEEFLDKRNVDTYFYHNFLDISQSHHRFARVSKVSNKTSFAIHSSSSELFSKKK